MGDLSDPRAARKDHHEVAGHRDIRRAAACILLAACLSLTLTIPADEATPLPTPDKSLGQLAWEKRVALSLRTRPAFAYVKEDPGLPRVLLIGDSISIGYTPATREFLAGKAVKYTREAPEVDFFSETHFFWCPDRNKILFITLNNRGNVGEGVVLLQDGEILLQGENHRPEGPLAYITRWNLDPGGVLKDTFMRKEKGEWVQGHVQEFVPKEQTLGSAINQ